MVVRSVSVDRFRLGHVPVKNVGRPQVRSVLVITGEVHFELALVQVKFVEVTQGTCRQIPILILAEAVSFRLTRNFV